MELLVSGVVVAGKSYNYQTAHTASITAGMPALTIAQLINGIYEITQSATVSLPFSTGTLTHAGITGGSSSNIAMDQSIDWSVINRGSSLGIATVQHNTAHTLIGSGVAAIGVSARFRNRVSAANVAITSTLS